MKRPAPPNARRSSGASSTSRAPAIFGENHITSTHISNALPTSDAHDGSGIITQHERGRREREQADPRRRAHEHQDGKYQLIAADRPEVREQKEPPILHIALTPAQVSAHKLQQCRRIFLPPKIFPRYHAHVVAGSPHQSRFDLVVTEDMPLLLAVSGQHRQMAMLDERFEPQDGVVPPIRTAIGLPPRASNRVGAHAESHAELKDAGEQAR